MDDKRKIYSVTELNRTARFALENGIGEVWVEGEISRLTRHASGHWYFTLKDADASVACAMFKQNNAAATFAPKDGLQVRVLGQASLYEPRGSYQLIIRKIEEAGKGSLQEQFEKLKAKLAAEGLFDAARKKPLPLLPQKIGVVTSPTGAAIRDIIHVLTRRFPTIEILLAPVTVQGEGAAAKIAAAIDYLNTRDDIDLMIVGRGGGSLEDLWAFNEEAVARAIAASRIPVISAVGHEIDFTISDFVADVRAPTPSAAAELAVPVKTELETQLTRLAARLGGSLQNQVYVQRERIPGFRQTMIHALTDGLRLRQQKVDEAGRFLAECLKNAVAAQKQRLPVLQQTMTHRLESAVAERKQNLRRIEVQLRALSPLAVLDRGYSLTQTADGCVVRDTAQIKPGDLLKTRLSKGTVISEVKEKEA
ncbi:MAG TPA: exodeoxyribonuclease VII large subunit [Pontiellaceae bacterium]|nr:exodeoxyribonuclease VII large subunit [Pontiellaceae bacterium]HPR83209.1 exodeoxyribonuclease VII large subunit [Pontiellaceae bacterium]